MTNLRLALREHTQAAHAATDASFGSLDLTSRRDYILFLRAHHAALQPLEAARRALAWPEQLPPPVDAAALVAADLAALGAPPAPPMPAPAISDAVGLTYVLAGSRFGNKFLRQSVAKSNDPDLRTASAYVNSAALDAYGKAFFAQLPRLDGADRIDAALTSASETFRLFQDAFKRGAGGAEPTET